MGFTICFQNHEKCKTHRSLVFLIMNPKPYPEKSASIPSRLRHLELMLLLSFHLTSANIRLSGGCGIQSVSPPNFITEGFMYWSERLLVHVIQAVSLHPGSLGPIAREKHVKNLVFVSANYALNARRELSGSKEYELHNSD